MTTSPALDSAPNALDVAASCFHLLVTGPHPLAVDGSALGHGLPARTLPLGQVRDLLLAPAATQEMKDVVWRELIRLARQDGPSWVIGCVGVALPGLKPLAARAVRAAPHLADDIAAELLAEFLHQIRHVDTGRPRIAYRMLGFAKKAALRVRGQDRRLGEADPSAAPSWLLENPAAELADPGPEAVLAEAVRTGHLTAQAADLIFHTRLRDEPIPQYAARTGQSYEAVCKRRKRAEAKLAAAISEGHVSVMASGVLSRPGI